MSSDSVSILGSIFSRATDMEEAIEYLTIILFILVTIPIDLNSLSPIGTVSVIQLISILGFLLIVKIASVLIRFIIASLQVVTDAGTKKLEAQISDNDTEITEAVRTHLNAKGDDGDS